MLIRHRSSGPCWRYRTVVVCNKEGCSRCKPTAYLRMRRFSARCSVRSYRRWTKRPTVVPALSTSTSVPARRSPCSHDPLTYGSNLTFQTLAASERISIFECQATTQTPKHRCSSDLDRVESRVTAEIPCPSSDQGASEDLSFCQFHRRFLGYASAANRGKIGRGTPSLPLNCLRGL
jgi:hypothetical protein